MGILNNEKYVGDVRYNKTYTDDSFRRHRNKGDVESPEVKDHIRQSLAGSYTQQHMMFWNSGSGNAVSGARMKSTSDGMLSAAKSSAVRAAAHSSVR